MIRADGFNGTVATGWDVVCSTRTLDRLGAGKRSDGMSHKSNVIASPEISLVGVGSARLCCTGHTIVAKFDPFGFGAWAASTTPNSRDDVRFRGKSGHGPNGSRCLLLTQSGHSTAKWRGVYGLDQSPLSAHHKLLSLFEQPSQNEVLRCRCLSNLRADRGHTRLFAA